jgi:hypothetical protein
MHLADLSDTTGRNKLQCMLKGGPPNEWPIDHQHCATFGCSSGHVNRSGKIRRHRLLNHDMQSSPGGFRGKYGAIPVVGKNVYGIETNAVE